MHILHVVGARPNFMKLAPVRAALAARGGVRQTLLHTGQHYDDAMSAVFLRQLAIPAPDINLAVGSGSHAAQTAQIMLRAEPVLRAHAPDWVVVYGDANSTLAAALVSAKLELPVAHVEAGLRCNDRHMPEEINRRLTDQVASQLFTPSADADANLQREGVAGERVHRVGNVMIDTLLRLLPQSESVTLPPLPARYALVTLHRPANVDDPAMLRAILAALARISADLPMVFPVHPRTRQRLADFAIPLPTDDAFHILEPVGYLEFLALQRRAAVVITDSGGVQEETTVLGVPCLTVREHTERPITITRGTNQLVGRDMARLEALIREIIGGGGKTGTVPPLWDGRAGTRIADVLLAGDSGG